MDCDGPAVASEPASGAGPLKTNSDPTASLTASPRQSLPCTLGSCCGSLMIIAGPGSPAGTGCIRGHRYDAIEAATTAMTALHATEPATPHLALHARRSRAHGRGRRAALYEERSLVRAMAMRRTLFVVTRDAAAGCGRVCGTAGRRGRTPAARQGGWPVPEGSWSHDWIAAASPRDRGRASTGAGALGAGAA